MPLRYLYLLAILIVLPSFVSNAQNPSPEFVKDINQSPAGAGIRELTRFSELAYFGARESAIDSALWVTDGTVVGTTPFAGGGDGFQCEHPRDITAAGDQLYFTCRLSELWTTDGHAEGTIRLSGPVGQADDLFLTGVTVFDAGVAFLALGDNGWDLWVSDGTPDGAKLFDLSASGRRILDDESLFAFGGDLFFGVFDEQQRPELWRIDATTGAMRRVAQITSAANYSMLRAFTVFRGRLYFWSTGPEYNQATLYRTDGSTAGTEQVLTVSSGLPIDHIVIDDRWLLSISSADTGRELFEFDVSTLSLRLVADVNSGAGDSNIRHLTRFGDRVLFKANDGANGAQLWLTDGTDAGTSRLTEIPAGDAAIEWIRASDGRAFFRVWLPGDSIQLWVTDGTPGGTTIVRTFALDGDDRNVASLAFDDSVIFAATDAQTGTELWISDGTLAGTRQLRDINTKTRGSEPRGSAVYNGTLIFGANDGVRGAEAWVSDGTSKGTTLLRDIAPGADGADVRSFTRFRDHVFFAANTAQKVQLWRTDTTRAGTELVFESRASFPGSMRLLGATGEHMYFSFSHPDYGFELWVTDGTKEGSRLVRDLNPGVVGSEPFATTAIGDTLYFAARTAQEGTQLWRTKGTAGSTWIVRRVPAAGDGARPSDLIAFQGALVFTAQPSLIGGRELWRSDGTYEGTSPLLGEVPDIQRPQWLFAAGEQFFFEARTDAAGAEPWRSDGTIEGTYMIADIRPGESGSSPVFLGVFQDRIWFEANSQNRGLWMGKSQKGGALQIVDTDTREPLGCACEIVEFGDGLMIRARSTDGRLGLWRKQPSMTTATRVDAPLGPFQEGYDVGPENLTVLDSALLFWAYDREHDLELWRIEAPGDGRQHLSPGDAQ